MPSILKKAKSLDQVTAYLETAGISLEDFLASDATALKASLENSDLVATLETELSEAGDKLEKTELSLKASITRLSSYESAIAGAGIKVDNDNLEQSVKDGIEQKIKTSIVSGVAAAGGKPVDTDESESATSAQAPSTKDEYLTAFEAAFAAGNTAEYNRLYKEARAKGFV